MPSVTLKLPANVTRRPRKDGTARYLFEVRRNRPDGWAPTIPLPVEEPRTGVESDLDEMNRIEADAKRLNAELAARRAGVAVAHPSGSLPAVAEKWKASSDFKELKPRTQTFYKDELRILEKWSAKVHHPPIAKMTLQAIMGFLALYKDRPSQRAALKRTLSALFSFARGEGIRRDHPFGVTVRVRRKKTQRKTPVTVWTASDVDAYCDAAKAVGWAGGAILLRAMWETSADGTDVMRWTKKENFKDEAPASIAYERGKTGIPARAPISAKLAEAIRSNGSLYLATDLKGRPYPLDDEKADEALKRHFKKVRAHVVANGGRRLIRDHLRHSAATDAIDAGASYEMTKSLTAHADDTMLKTLYVQRSFEQAMSVQRKRGIIT